MMPLLPGVAQQQHGGRAGLGCRPLLGTLEGTSRVDWSHDEIVWLLPPKVVAAALVLQNPLALPGFLGLHLRDELVGRFRGKCIHVSHLWYEMVRDRQSL